MFYRLLAVAVAVIALEGCATPPPPPPAPVEDLNVGMSNPCTFTPVQPVAGNSVNASISMANNGWCAVRVTEADHKPFLLGLVRQRPEHGELQIRNLGGETRLEYNPHPGFAGADTFLVALRSSNPSSADALVNVAVQVSPGPGIAGMAPPEEVQPASTRARPTTRSRTRTPARTR